jgi:non-ribosomal peptide synthetase component E (peptide arylation enzyme)
MASNRANSGPGETGEALTLYTLLQRRAAWIPDAVAVAAPGCPPLTYRALLHLVEETAKTLQGWGLISPEKVSGWWV